MDDLAVIYEMQKFQPKKGKQDGRAGLVYCMCHITPMFYQSLFRNEVMRQKSRVNIVLALNKLTVQSPTKKTDNEN